MRYGFSGKIIIFHNVYIKDQRDHQFQNKKIESKKAMFSLFFSLNEVNVIKYLKNDEKINSSFVVNIILSEIDSKIKTNRQKSASK